jgi:hypothetical protein
LLGFTYYNEISIKHNRVLANVLMYLSIVFGSFICLIIASYTKGLRIFDIVVLILLIPLLLLSFAMRETLYFLYNNKAKQEFFKTMKLIAEINEVRLNQVFSKLHPEMIEEGASNFQYKNKFNSAYGPTYSYKDFSKDFNEFSMRGTEYNKENPFYESNSKSIGNSKDMGKAGTIRGNMFNYSIDKKYIEDSMGRDTSNQSRYISNL